MAFVSIIYIMRQRSGCLRIGFGALTILAAITTPALAQNRAEPIRAAIAEARAEEAKAKPLLDRMTEIANQNERKKKDHEAIDAQIKAVQPRLDRYNANLRKYETAQAAYRKRLEAYSAKCSGKVPQDRYRPCLEERGEIVARKLELDKEKAALEAEYQVIEAELKDKNARLDAIAKEMAANVAAWEKARQDYKAIYDRAEAAKKRLVALCLSGDEAKDPFAVRLCLGVGWDAAKKDFTALYDLPAPPE
jgi:chromosome segregation ATPase